MLFLAVLRGSLWHLMVWVKTCLDVLKEERSAKISVDVVAKALEHIRGVTGQSGAAAGEHEARYNLACSVSAGSDVVDLYEGAHCILSELVEQSVSYTQSCTGDPAAASSNASGGSGVVKSSEAYVWGSNSSRQLSESAQDKYLLPMQSAAFADVQKVKNGVCEVGSEHNWDFDIV